MTDRNLPTTEDGRVIFANLQMGASRDHPAGELLVALHQVDDRTFAGIGIWQTDALEECQIRLDVVEPKVE